MNVLTGRFRPTLITGILVLIALAVGAAAITTQSLWMDEGNMMYKAVTPSVSILWACATHYGGSEIQMPLFTLCLWGWEKIAGVSEYALRAINLPFLALMVLSFRRYRFWPLVCLTSPFVLYYVGELRPYMFQMAGGALGFSALCGILQRDGEMEDMAGVHALIGSALFLAATSLTAAVCSVGLVLALVVARPCWLARGRFWLKVAGWVPIALLLLGYYGYTLMAGYRGTMDRGGGLLSMGFGCYEMMGLLGLGPGRDAFRSADIVGLIAGNPWLPLAALVIVVAWWSGLKEFFGCYSWRARVALVCSVFFPLLIFIGLSVVAHFSVLGRHMSPLIPVLLVPLACACEAAVTRPLLRPVVIAVLLCGGVSAVMLRFSNKHARDDYRGATRLVLEALRKGRSVLWRADMNTPRYYAFREGGAPLVQYIQILEPDPREDSTSVDLKSFDIIFINRPDLSGAQGERGTIFRQAGFKLCPKLTGFEIWDRR